MSEKEEPRAGLDLDLVGHVLDGRYRILSLVGRGGMSTVYLADDERMSRKVCVKVPHPSFLAEPGFRERFTREVESLTRMEHPHVVKVHDTGEYRGLPYAVLQYLAGGSLRGRFAWHGGRVPPDDVPKWLPAVAGALQYLHDHGLVHRDVKPTNILFDEQGNVFVADFGIAKVLGERETGLTQTGQTPGSPEYMAPEVVTGGDIGPSYDQYALGIVVYQALSGRFPFEGKTPLQVLVKKRTERAVPLGKYAPEAPSGVSAAVMRAIDRDPARRFPSCVAFAEAYERGLHTGSTPVPITETGPGAPAKAGPTEGLGASPRRVRIAMAVAALGLLAAGLLLWRPWEKKDTSPVVPASEVTAEIENPAHGAWLASREVEVRGSVRGGTPAEVLVRAAEMGKPGEEFVKVPVVGGRFVKRLTLAQDGTYAVTVALSPQTALGLATVHVDTTPPVLEVTSPASDGGFVEGTSGVLHGKATDANLLEVRREGATLPLTTTSEGVFDLLVPVKEGEEVAVVLVAVDRAGNSSEKVVRTLRRAKAAEAWRSSVERAITAAKEKRWADARQAVKAARDAGAPPEAIPAAVATAIAEQDAIDAARAKAAAEPPKAAETTISWFEPNGKAYVIEADVLVRGAVALALGADAVTVNGAAASLENGRFEARVPVKAAGELELVVVATKGGSAVGEARRKIEAGDAPAAWKPLLRGWATPMGVQKDAATGLPSKIVRTRDGGVMVLVPAGTFLMGAVPRDTAATPAEKPQRKVTLTRPYYLDATEVSNEQFAAFVGDTGRKTTAETTGSAVTLKVDGSGFDVVAGVTWRAPYVAAKVVTLPTHPVVHVSWDDAAAFAAWVGAALPTEAQFERAARAGTDGTVFAWGESGTPPKGAGNFLGQEFQKSFPSTIFTPIPGYDDAIVATAPVGTFGANAYGLSDLVGNVWEWCADWYATPGAYGDPTDPTGPESGTQRVLRGGSWFNGEQELRLSARASGAPTSCFVYRGFRCARTVP